MADLPLVYRPLELGDLDAIMAIEEAVFPLPWSRNVYRRELEHGRDSYYRALDLVQAERRILVAYAGYWILDDEAHLMTIAVDPAWQGRGIGRWLLLELFDDVAIRGAHAVTLEVRAGNRRARLLYRRMGFRVVGRRKGYYTDNREDALIMTTPALDSPPMAELRRGERLAVAARLGDWLR